MKRIGRVDLRYVPPERGRRIIMCHAKKIKINSRSTATVVISFYEARPQYLGYRRSAPVEAAHLNDANMPQYCGLICTFVRLILTSILIFVLCFLFGFVWFWWFLFGTIS